jgi:HK97 family phage portal protein
MAEKFNRVWRWWNGIPFFWGVEKGGVVPSQDNPLALPSPAEEKADLDDLYTLAARGAYTESVKNFDWQHYNQVNDGGQTAPYQDEYQITPTIRVLKISYAKEQLIHMGANAISRQFMSARFFFKRRDASGNLQQIHTHPMLALLNGPASESRETFWSTGMLEKFLTGNLFIWLAPNRKKLIRLPTERINLMYKEGSVAGYRLLRGATNDGNFAATDVDLAPEEVLHIKMPNPFSQNVGLSPLIASNHQTLIDKYGHEFTLGFFIRGGQTTGIIQTATTNVTQLMRLFRTLMQAFGSRRNAHADKILPQGAEWKERGLTFQEIGLQEMLKNNARRMFGDMGVPSFLMGDSESVNYANAKEQMRAFWELTIIPYQKILCGGLMHSPLAEVFAVDPTWELCVDNSEVEYLSEEDKLIEQDKSLEVLTINERRVRLGFPELPAEDARGSKLLMEMKAAKGAEGGLTLSLGVPGPGVQQNALPALPAPEGGEVIDVPAQTTDAGDEAAKAWREGELKAADTVPAKTESTFAKEYGGWEEIVIANIESRETAEAKLAARADTFAKSFTESVFDEVRRTYKAQIESVLLQKGARLFVTKEQEQDRRAKMEALWERAASFLRGEIAGKAKDSFLGYSKTFTEIVYREIDRLLAEGRSTDDVAAQLRLKDFPEYYAGQLSTVVRTELGAAIGLTWQKFGEDLTTVSKRMKKKWMAKRDDFTRETHVEVDDAEIEGPGEDVMKATFGKTGCRWPGDKNANASEVINCRCRIRYQVSEWKE